MRSFVYMAIGAVPDPGKPTAPPGVEVDVNTLLSWGLWGVFVVCIIGLLGCAGSLAIAHRRGDLGEEIGKLTRVGVACILAGAAAPIVNALFV